METIRDVSRPFRIHSNRGVSRSAGGARNSAICSAVLSDNDIRMFKSGRAPPSDSAHLRSLESVFALLPTLPEKGKIKGDPISSNNLLDSILLTKLSTFRPISWG